MCPMRIMNPLRSGILDRVFVEPFNVEAWLPILGLELLHSQHGRLFVCPRTNHVLHFYIVTRRS